MWNCVPHYGIPQIWICSCIIYKIFFFWSESKTNTLGERREIWATFFFAVVFIPNETITVTEPIVEKMQNIFFLKILFLSVVMAFSFLSQYWWSVVNYYITSVQHGVKFQCDVLMLNQMAAIKVIGSHTRKSLHIALETYPYSLGKNADRLHFLFIHLSSTYNQIPLAFINQ